jgi:hypothetical protein
MHVHAPHVHTQTRKPFHTVRTPLAFWSVIELVILYIVQLADVHHKLYVVFWYILFYSTYCPFWLFEVLFTEILFA